MQLGFAYIHAAKLDLPLLDRRITDAVLLAQIGDLFQNTNDLDFGEHAALHIWSFRLGQSLPQTGAGEERNVTKTKVRQPCLLTAVNDPSPEKENLKQGGLVMNTRFHLLFASLLAISAICVRANAEDAEFGARIYADHCVVCHGETGSGDGIVGELFAKRPSNLRLLSKGNNGVFPQERVVEVIYGRADIRGHGQSKMPIWGDYFMTEALNGLAIDPADAAMITQGRVLSVASYLQKLQVE